MKKFLSLIFLLAAPLILFSQAPKTNSNSSIIEWNSIETATSKSGQTEKYLTCKDGSTHKLNSKVPVYSIFYPGKKVFFGIFSNKQMGRSSILGTFRNRYNFPSNPS